MAHDFEKKWRSEDVRLQENVDFSAMLLNDRVLYGLKKAGFKKPSPIQLEAIPISKIGKDLLVQAKSGTGKTLVFVITALQILRRKLFRPQIIILAPAREIATQICSVFESVGSGFPKLTCCSFIGGMSVMDDVENARTCQIVVGTPGRLNQLIRENALPTNSIRLLVIDEADRMLHISFKEDINAIFNSLPEDKQVIATSATYPEKTKKLLLKYLREPHFACLNSREIALLGIIHYAKVVKSALMPMMQYKLKLAALEEILKAVKFSQCLVFCNGVQRVEVLYKDIKQWGFSTTYISSAKEQQDRLKAIDRLKHFKCKVFVSSDVTSRGIDAENVDIVINFDLAYGTECYMHRAGRAGRYGSIGINVTIIEEKQLVHLKKMEQEASFKVYKLPDPVPVDLIQLRNLGDYVIAETEPRVPSEDSSAGEEGDVTTPVDDKNIVIEKSNTESVEKSCVHAPGDSSYTSASRTDVEKVANASKIAMDNSSQSKKIVHHLISNKADIESSEMEVSNSLPSKKDDVQNLNEGFSDLSIREVGQIFETVVNSEIKADLNTESVKVGTIDNMGNECASHFLNGNEVKNIDQNLCEPASHIQLDTGNFAEKDDVGIPESDFYVSNGLDNDDVDHVINAFLNEYKSNKDKYLSENESEEGESTEKKHTVCAINTLKSEKYPHVYEVSKKCQEGENKILIIPFEDEGEEGVNEVMPFQNGMHEAGLNNESVEVGKVHNMDSECASHFLNENVVELIGQNSCESGSQPIQCVQSNTENFVEKNDAGSVPEGDACVSNGLDNDDLSHVVSFFINEYKSNKNKHPNENESKEEENTGEKHISVSAINTLMSKKYSYVYEVCKKYQEENNKECNASGEDKSEEKVNEVLTMSFQNHMLEQDTSSVAKSADIDLQSDSNFTSDSIKEQNPVNLTENFEEYSSQLKCKTSYSEASDSELDSNDRVRHALGESYKNSKNLLENPRRKHLREVSNNYESTPAKSRGNMFEAVSESDSDDTELSDEVNLDDSQFSSSSTDTKEGSSVDCSDSSSSSSEDSYCHNKSRTGKQNPSLVSTSESEESSSECVQNYDSRRYSHSVGLKSHCQVPCSRNYPQYFCSSSKRRATAHGCASRVQNHHGHSAFTRQQLNGCGSSCFQPSQHRCHSDSRCSQMQVCCQWHKTFYNQWKHLQCCINSAKM